MRNGPSLVTSCLGNRGWPSHASRDMDSIEIDKGNALIDLIEISREMPKGGHDFLHAALVPMRDNI